VSASQLESWWSIHGHWVNYRSARCTRAFASTARTKSIIQARGNRSHFFDSCSCSKKCDASCCSGYHRKFTLRLLYRLRKLESNVYFALWGKLWIPLKTQHSTEVKRPLIEVSTKSKQPCLWYSSWALATVCVSQNRAHQSAALFHPDHLALNCHCPNLAREWSQRVILTSSLSVKNFKFDSSYNPAPVKIENFSYNPAPV